MAQAAQFKTAEPVTVGAAATVVHTEFLANFNAIVRAEIENVGVTNALTAFKIQLQDHPDGEFYDSDVTLAYTPNDPATLAAEAKTHITVPLSGISAVRFVATSAAGTTVSIKGGASPWAGADVDLEISAAANVGLLNKAEVEIDPAIEGKQDTIITALEALASYLGVNYTPAVIDLAAGATGDIIAAPGASKQLWIYAIIGTGDVAGTIKFIDSTPTDRSGTMPVGETGGFCMPHGGVSGAPWIKCATDKKFQATTDTCTFDGIVVYAVVDV